MLINDKENLKKHIENGSEEEIEEVIEEILNDCIDDEKRINNFNYICEILRSNNKRIDTLFIIGLCPDYILSECIENLVYITDDLFYLKSLNLYPTAVKKVEKQIMKNDEEYFKKHMANILRYSITYNKNLVIDILYMIFKEVCENEKVPFYSVDFYQSGSFSKVYSVGNKIIKVGDERENTFFKNNPYILKPLLRRNLDGVFVEIIEKVDDKSYVSDEQLYDLYKKMRDIGLIWIDICEENVGYLLKDNKFYWNKEITDLDKPRLLDEGVGKDVVLKKGDLIILDADFIYNEGEEHYDSMYNTRTLYYNFETRYRKEKK